MKKYKIIMLSMLLLMATSAYAQGYKVAIQNGKGDPVVSRVEAIPVANSAQPEPVTADLLPVHMPVEALALGTKWDGWSEVNIGDIFIVHHQYSVNSFQNIAGKECAEIGYVVRGVPKQMNPGDAEVKGEIRGSGRFYLDIRSGITLANVWEIEAYGTKISYAAVLE